ncbi:MAG TPA: MarR family winged helix-turn-helix transcriptional regulator [Polyangia bacterium]|nr:MarR family winged helix-turn-helix transcriptional regulator [Polyangia bacterium]
MSRRAPEEVLDSFSAVARGLRAAAAQTYATFEVGSAQAKLLRHIGRESVSSQAELARLTGSDPTLTGRVLGTLIARGWVRRRRSEEDRRQYVLELTAAGRRARARVEAARQQVARRMVAALDQTDIRDFERIARKLRAAFEGVQSRQK